MNIRTFRILTMPVPLLAALLIPGIISAPGSRWSDISAVAILFFFGYTAFGVWFGALHFFHKLYFGCPFCGKRRQVFSWGRNRLILDCPECGEVAATMGFLRFRYERLEPEHNALTKRSTGV